MKVSICVYQLTFNPAGKAIVNKCGDADTNSVHFIGERLMCAHRRG
jgi:hypothetical protein